MILAAIIAFIIIFLDAVIQAYLIEKEHVWINHFISGTIALIYCFVIAFVCIAGFWKVAAGTLVLLSERWIFFSPALVVFRNRYRPIVSKLPLNYISSKKEKNSTLDLVLFKSSKLGISQYIIKFSLFILLIFFYIFLDNCLILCNLQENKSNKMEEFWKDVQGFEGIYQVSNIGRVKSLSREVKGAKNLYIIPERMLSSRKDKDGYLIVTASKKGKPYTFKCHRLVAIAYIPNPENKLQVNHKNGIKSDNSIDNLEWATAKENLRHAFDTGLRFIPKGETNKVCKLKNSDIPVIRKMLSDGVMQKDIAKKFGVGKTIISYINTGRVWTEAA